MHTNSSLVFKIAAEEWEFEAIHRLNYKTFVEEIPQHTPAAERRLVDKFHHENTYVICLDGQNLVGMLAMRDRRPFSLDQKLPNLDDHLPKGRIVVEIRLLSVEKEYRNGYVFRGLLNVVLDHGKSRGWNLAIISGTTRQIKLYQHLGFVPFGPLVGSGEARFQPMYLTLETIEEKAASVLVPPKTGDAETLPVSFLPGPVDVHDEVREAFEGKPISHRGAAFAGSLQDTKHRLLALTQARHVEILVGSGSLSNDVVAGQLSLLEQPGLVLSNGEFGERLIDHAERFGLEFEKHRLDWGETFDLDLIRQKLVESPRLKWLWAVHCETSTGILNDLEKLKQICGESKVRLCLDCISSIGTLPVDLRGVYLASCVSGKGLGSFPGLSMVFYNHELQPAPKRLPRYLDLGFYSAQDGIPFTHSSNLLAALQTALKRVNWEQKFTQLVELSAWLRGRIKALGYTIIGAEAHRSPAVVTVALPVELSSKTIGWQLQKAGYLLSYRSGYLLQRNWIQVCLMGEVSRENLDAMLEIFGRFRPRQPVAAAP
jgi:aspartate aminotransferase-like enzyme